MCGSNPVSSIVRGATDVATFGTAEVGGASSKLGNAVSGVVGGGGGPPGAPNLPAFPGMTPQQQQIMQQWQSSLDQQNKVTQGVQGQLGNNQSILQMLSGLVNPDGTVNQSALSSLTQQLQGGLQTGAQAGQGQLSSLAGITGATNATAQAYQNALNGNAPANRQLQFQQTQDFNNMKQQAAQQGIIIQGDDWNSASSNSTAGQKLIQNFSQNAGIANQNYQLGYLGQLSGNLGQLSGAGSNTAATGMGLVQNPYQTQTGLYGQSITGGMGSLQPFLTQYQQGLGQIFNPYQVQQIGPYQQQMAQQQANYQAGLQQYQANQSMLGGIGSIAGMGIGAMVGGPAGAMIGGNMGSQLGGYHTASGGGVMAYPGMNGSSGMGNYPTPPRLGSTQ